MNSTLAEICRKKSSLTDVQIHILQNSEPLLQFASDLSQRRLTLFVPAARAGAFIPVAVRQPLFGSHEGTVDIDAVGSVISAGEEPVVAKVMAEKRSLTALKEIDYGRTEPMIAYPFEDNGGKTVAVFTFTGKVAPNKRILTETAFRALQVPATAGTADLYKRLSVQDGIILIDSAGTIEYADDMAENIMRLQGHTAPLGGENIYSGRFDLAAAKHALITRQGAAEEMHGDNAVVTMRVIPLLRQGKLFRLILIMSERTELRRKEEELLVKLSVIKEIHHRVKNNLQTVAGLLRMQMRRVEHEEAKAALQEALNRILSISLVHETLAYHEEERIDVSEMGRRLMDLLAQSLVGKDSRIAMRFDGAPVFISSRTAVSLALVLNELLTNAVLHGFADLAEGEVVLAVTVGDNTCEVAVTDTGRGLKEGCAEKGGRLGLEIVRTVVEKDLHGVFSISPREIGGTTATLSFPCGEE